MTTCSARDPAARWASNTGRVPEVYRRCPGVLPKRGGAWQPTGGRPAPNQLVDPGSQGDDKSPDQLKGAAYSQPIGSAGRRRGQDRARSLRSRVEAEAVGGAAFGQHADGQRPGHDQSDQQAKRAAAEGGQPQRAGEYRPGPDLHPQGLVLGRSGWCTRDWAVHGYGIVTAQPAVAAPSLRRSLPNSEEEHPGTGGDRAGGRRSLRARRPRSGARRSTPPADERGLPGPRTGFRWRSRRTARGRRPWCSSTGGRATGATGGARRLHWRCATRWWRLISPAMGSRAPAAGPGTMAAFGDVVAVVEQLGC